MGRMRRLIIILLMAYQIMMGLNELGVECMYVCASALGLHYTDNNWMKYEARLLM